MNHVVLTIPLYQRKLPYILRSKAFVITIVVGWELRSLPIMVLEMWTVERAKPDMESFSVRNMDDANEIAAAWVVEPVAGEDEESETGSVALSLPSSSSSSKSWTSPYSPGMDHSYSRYGF